MSNAVHDVDLCVVGLGPTGRALAHRALEAGMSVAAVDPRPDRLWGPTYSCWVDELPAWLPREVIGALVTEPVVHARTEHRIARPYAVLSKPRLRDALPIEGAKLLTGRAKSVAAHRVDLGGDTVTAATVVDARGLPPTANRQAASAHGIFVDAEKVRGFVGDGEGLLLDWRDENGAGPDEPPSFLYAMPIGDGTVIFEETSLGLRGGMPQRELRRRTVNRLRAHGIELTGDEPSEAAHYPLDQSPPSRFARGEQAVDFGSRGGMMHPCTGYSVADSFALTDTLVDALRDGDDPVRQLWRADARLVYWMRRKGLNGLGRLTTEQSKAMFEAFFSATPRQQRALLSTHDDPIPLAAVLFGTVAHTWPFRWRYALIGWTHRHRWDGFEY